MMSWQSGAGRRRPLRRRPWPYASSLPMEQIELGRRPAAARAVQGSAPPLTNCRGRASSTDPLREIAVYRDVLAAAMPDAPRSRCLGRRSGPRVAVRGAAGGHTALAGRRPGGVARGRPLAGRHACAGAAAGTGPAALRRRPSAPTACCWRAGFRGPRTWPGRSLQQLASLPARLIHGEFTPANVLVQRSCGRIRIRPLDWELAGIGPGVLDVAALTAGNWSARDRDRIEDAYRDACPPHLRPTAHDLDLARLLLAAQWSGWCDGWAAAGRAASGLARSRPSTCWSGWACEVADRQCRRLRPGRERQPGRAARTRSRNRHQHQPDGVAAGGRLGGGGRPLSSPAVAGPARRPGRVGADATASGASATTASTPTTRPRWRPRSIASWIASAG